MILWLAMAALAQEAALQPPPSASWAPYLTAVIVACITGAVQISVAIIAQKKHEVHEAVATASAADVRDIKAAMGNGKDR